MRVRIGCIDGNTYESDEINEAELQQYLDEQDGLIGTGDFSGPMVRTVDDFVELINQMLSGSVNGAKTTHIDLEIDGKKRKFLFDKIVWSEIVRG
jgi:hypothetical protein